VPREKESASGQRSPSAVKAYPFAEIEAKWQKYWEETGLFRMDPGSRREKFYCLVMFPYPSGTLHVGHGRNYIIGDVVARYMMMRGKNVLSPMGWDAFGLPAENAAIGSGIHPAEYTRANVARMKRQLLRWGVGYDWTREICTSDPSYYKWTQWIFLKLYQAGLAYRKRAPVNWCPSCNTALANEEVVAGGCERCGHTVEERYLEQWFFRITRYAERLLKDLDLLKEWPERVRVMQANWIGKSEGARIDFGIEGTAETLSVFTTRPDTVFGVTFVCLAPEHPVLERLVKGCPKGSEIEAFISRVRKQKIAERGSLAGEKEGMFIGRYVLNPLSGERVPLWVANYALMEYGTGAVMGVPAHDQRDFEFAKKYGLPIRVVIQPEGKSLDAEKMTEAYVEDGVQVNSGQFSGLPNRVAMERIIEHLERSGKGARQVTYRIRDWLISRQRYWGAPIPIIYCNECGTVAVPEKDLPVLLPERVDFKPSGRSPLADVAEFVNVPCPTCGRPARRETDTIAQWLCSCWYFLRYLSPKEERRPFDRELVDKWLPVDQYIGGVEHAVLHLLYSRFVIKVLYDLGEVGFVEPFRALFTQGMIVKDGAKMSKSRGNVVSADDIIERYGADTQRLYTLFMGPPEKDAEWNDRGVVGAFRFLGRIWEDLQEALKIFQSAGVREAGPREERLSAGMKALHRKVHQTIKKVTEDIEDSWHFNTAIASIMELSNEIRERAAPFSRLSGEDLKGLREAFETMALLLGPFVPHIAEEMWAALGKPPSLFRSAWPSYDPKAVVAEEIEVVVQVNGKVRAHLKVRPETPEEELKSLALAHERVRAFVKGKKIRRVVVVPKRLVNIVVS